MRVFGEIKKFAWLDPNICSHSCFILNFLLLLIFPPPPPPPPPPLSLCAFLLCVPHSLFVASQSFADILSLFA